MISGYACRGFGRNCWAGFTPPFPPAKLMAGKTPPYALMALPANVSRWGTIKGVYYGSYDENFVRLIDAIEEHERR